VSVFTLDGNLNLRDVGCRVVQPESRVDTSYR